MARVLRELKTSPKRALVRPLVRGAFSFVRFVNALESRDRKAVLMAVRRSFLLDRRSGVFSYQLRKSTVKALQKVVIRPSGPDTQLA